MVSRLLKFAAHAAGQDMLKQQQLCPCLQAMLAMEDTGALLRFVQRPNRVALCEGKAALRAAGRYSELVALYQERGQFEAALDLLRTLSLVRSCPHRPHLPGSVQFRGPFTMHALPAC